MNDVQLPADDETRNVPMGAQVVSVLNLDGLRKSDFVIDEVPVALVYYRYGLRALGSHVAGQAL